ncbi:hypothetical protein HYT18_05055 [Candidatus Microgenomates bacterium]|nr:hypothetical protein [Candidatus Microgenomates bacterium]
MRIFAVLILSALFLLISFPVWAQDATSPAAAKRQQTQDRVAQQRSLIQDKLADLRARIASREAALKAKLQTFRDQRKAQTVERINSTLRRINEKFVSQMTNYLDRMTSILNRLEDRVNKPTPDIKDPALARAAIADARDAIATASAKVEEQSLMDYTIQVSTESSVRKDAKAARDKLHTDLRNLRQLLIDAKQAVANAIRVAKSGKTEEATQSGQ